MHFRQVVEDEDIARRYTIKFWKKMRDNTSKWSQIESDEKSRVTTNWSDHKSRDTRSREWRKVEI